jgi:hypothetical protein
MVSLSQNRVDRALRDIELGIARLPKNELFLQHYWAHYAQVQVLLYTGKGGHAWDEVDRHWLKITRSMIVRTRFHWIEALHMRSRAALAAAALEVSATRDRTRLLKIARHSTNEIRRFGTARSFPLAYLTDAGVLALTGRLADAAASLYQAADGFDAVEMGHYAAVARLLYGKLLDNARGAPWEQQALAWMAAQQIRAPNRFAEMLAPGVLIAP